MTVAENARESWIGVVGLAVGLAVAALAFAMPFLLPAHELDAHAVLAERFALAALPFGLEPREALDLPLGERVVLIGMPSSSTEPLRVEIATPSEEPPAGSPAAPASADFFDWSTLQEGAKDQPPAQVAVVWYPRARAESVMRSLFWNTGAGPAEMMMGPLGGSVVLDRGEIPWGEYGAPFVRERRYGIVPESGGTQRFFRETMRVNLSRGGVPCVLHATWEDGLPSSKERLEELLASFGPKP